jgi:hypothetical protein
MPRSSELRTPDCGPGTQHRRHGLGMALGLLARHPDRPALAGTPALKGEAAPLQAR